MEDGVRGEAGEDGASGGSRCEGRSTRREWTAVALGFGEKTGPWKTTRRHRMDLLGAGDDDVGRGADLLGCGRPEMRTAR